MVDVLGGLGVCFGRTREASLLLVGTILVLARIGWVVPPKIFPQHINDPLMYDPGSMCSGKIFCSSTVVGSRSITCRSEQYVGKRVGIWAGLVVEARRIVCAQGGMSFCRFVFCLREMRISTISFPTTTLNGPWHVVNYIQVEILIPVPQFGLDLADSVILEQGFGWGYAALWSVVAILPRGDS